MTTPEPTLRALLARRDLALRLVSQEGDLSDDALDLPLRWVHSSDLTDPTPFLADELLLLTTGTQFADAGDDPEPYREYVARLAARDVRGLGFGTEVVRDGVPAPLADACRAVGMPLFEVPYRTPFIALARANAEAIAAQAYARRTWVLTAQRAISLAALRQDGIAATVAELARQLDAWVGLFDAGGTLKSSSSTADARHRLDASALAELTEQAGTVLRRGGGASSTLDLAGQHVTLQTLGRAGHLRGLLAIVGPHLDVEARSVVTAVIAMAGLALEQNAGLQRAHTTLRTGLLHAFLAGDSTLPRRIARELWGPLPEGPLIVAVARLAPSREDSALDWLEHRLVERQGALFFARGEDGLAVVVSADDVDIAPALARLFDAGVGQSDRTTYADIAAGHRQAVTALRQAASGTVVRFADTAPRGVLSALDTPAARALAERRLAPLRAHDERHGTALVATIRAWLEHDARIDEAAAALGVHRHTVRARIAQAQRLLGVDLASFPMRAEVWAALAAHG